MKYILQNKNQKNYLKYISRLKMNHYVIDVAEATLFTKKEANTFKEKFKHPEYWDIIGIRETRNERKYN